MLHREETTDDSFQPGGKFKGPYRLLKVPRTSMELIRGDVSSNIPVKDIIQGKS